MFGFVKPLKCELRVKDWEHYQAVYCGLCNTLKRKYYVSARFIINYDFTFLAIILEAVNKKRFTVEYKRCIASPHKKKCAVIQSDELDFAAAASVILTWWKLFDTIEDSSFWRSLPARCAVLFLKGAYHKARSELSDFDTTVKMCLNELHVIESNREQSLDHPADTFARILANLSSFFSDEYINRPLYEMFYHIGRIIYLQDALCDIDEDMISGNYNPIIARFSLNTKHIPREIKDEVVFTINQSIHAAGAAFALIDEGEQKSLIENVLYLGIPAMVETIYSGAKPKKEKKIHERPI